MCFLFCAELIYQEVPRVRADSQHPGHSAGRISSQLPDGWSHRNRRRGGRRAVHEWSEQPVQQKKISFLPTLEFFTQTSARERNLIGRNSTHNQKQARISSMNFNLFLSFTY
ncbi:hypothetical protein CEXT_407661 [Caerostris extrusa]|uniref:Uncharacterized protein n=1 Tax=Caerostris extrusa TaxID=172846 RepID=A0AAV4MV09_CAEEX|nr:hypothetical protein CEXT_407661 [Caerostris extrusa]